MVRLFRSRLEWETDRTDRFRIVTTTGQKLVVTLQQERAAFFVEGAESLVGQFETLVDVLSRKQFETRQSAQVLLLQRDAQKQLESYLPKERLDDQSRMSTQGVPARSVSFQEPVNSPQEPIEDKPDSPQPLPLGQFEGVEIDTLPDLDVIILRGRDQELAQLSEIVRQLEQILSLIHI